MYIIIYDFGTSSIKTCLFNIDSEIHIVANSTADYGIYISENGGAEQDPEEWWEAICSTTRALFDHSEVKPDEIEGIAFCSQMAGTVLVDEDANGELLSVISIGETETLAPRKSALSSTGTTREWDIRAKKKEKRRGH